MNKGMPIWEQHVEKAVLGIAVILLLGAFALIVLDLDPISADVSGRTYSPAELGDVMVERSQELGRKLRPDSAADVSQLEAIEIDGGAGFAAALDRRIGPSGRPPRIAPGLASALLPAQIGSVDVWYYEPDFKALRMDAAVAQSINTIAPSEFDDPSAAPSDDYILTGTTADVVWTTPAAVIDLQGIRRELSNAAMRSDPPRNEIPSNWYNDRPYVIDVVFERQVMDASRGTWGPIETVEVFPGAFSLREMIADKAAADELDADFRSDVWFNLDDKVKQVEILRPEFFATVNDWDALSTIEESTVTEASAEEEGLDEEEADRQRRIRELKGRIKSKTTEIRRISGTLSELGGPLEEDEVDPGSGSSGGRRPGDRGSPGIGGSDGIAGSGAGRKSGASNALSEADKQRRIKLTAKLGQAERRLETLQSQLAELDPTAETEAEVDGPEIDVVDLAVDGDVRVWCHDLYVDQGMTYRYRVRVDMFNPFFGRGSLLLKEQAKLADEFTITSKTSDWSDPVKIDPPVEFFVVRATDGGGSMGMGQARIEMYRYVDGRRIVETFTVEPGEPIGGPEFIDGQDVDFTSGWYLVDVVDDPASIDGALDREDNARVVCRRMDGKTVEMVVPTDQLRDRTRTKRRFEAESAAASSSS